MTNDTVFSEQMRPVFVDEPSEVKRRLKAPFPESWSIVCIGETQKIVSITEYLYEEKFTDVLGVLKELARKESLPIFRKNPERLDIHLEIAAKKIIERVLKK